VAETVLEHELGPAPRGPLMPADADETSGGDGAVRKGSSIAWVFGKGSLRGSLRQSRHSSLVPKGVEQLSARPAEVPPLIGLRSSVVDAAAAPDDDAAGALSAQPTAPHPHPATPGGKKAAALSSAHSTMDATYPSFSTTDSSRRAPAKDSASCSAPVAWTAGSTVAKKPAPRAAAGKQQQQPGPAGTGAPEIAPAAPPAAVVAGAAVAGAAAAKAAVAAAKAAVAQSAAPPGVMPADPPRAPQSDSVGSSGGAGASSAGSGMPPLILPARPPEPSGGLQQLPAGNILPDGSMQSPALNGMTLVDLIEYKKEGYFDDAEFGVIKRQLLRAIGSLGF
jgi:hypothetical protein